MSMKPIRDIVIVGGGTAGWMAAAAFAKILKGAYSVRLVESDAIGTIGVGEATIPHIRNFNAALEIDEDEFVRATQGTFKLGIQFVNWGRQGDSYIHGFGSVGADFAGLPFQHHWLRRRQAGAPGALGTLDPYSINTAAALAGKFMPPRTDMTNSPLSQIGYAYHFDAGLYARFLRAYSEQRGVRRTEGRINDVLRREDGAIDALVLDGGETVRGDFFIDCTGLAGLLIEKTLGAGYDDWGHWLLCDRAIAVPCASVQPLLPYTRATAHAAGWQWRIPLQHRIGNGHVFSSRFMDEDQAKAILMDNLDGEALAEPRTIRFTPGRRKRFWSHNCVAVGLSAGFFEPIESTNIHLIQTAISRIINFFPHAGFDPADIAEYNAQTHVEYERVRDFVVLHYKATERDDSPFWNHVRAMEVPDTLMRRIEVYRSSGRVFRDGNELFAEPSWLQVLQGQRIEPRAHHPLAALTPDAEAEAFLANIRATIAKCVAVMPAHADFIAARCKAGPPA